MNYFEFNDIRSTAFGLHIEAKRIFDSPTFEQQFKAIPGRNGDLIIPNNRYSNVTVSYTCFFKKENIEIYADTVRRIKAWLFSCNGKYTVLTDSYDERYFRYATVSSAISIDEQLNKLGSFTVTFSCLPFKYSYDGMSEYSTTDGLLILNNPEAFESQPLIKITCIGALNVLVGSNNGESFEINIRDTGSLDKTIIIDCERFCVYSENELMNNYCTFSNGFPVFRPGVNSVSVDGDYIYELAAIPRWRTL